MAMLCRDRPGPWEGLTVGGRQIVAKGGRALSKTGPHAVGSWAIRCQGRPAPAKGLPLAAGPLATPSQKWPGPWQTLPRAGRALAKALPSAGWSLAARRQALPGLLQQLPRAAGFAKCGPPLGKVLPREPGPWQEFPTAAGPLARLCQGRPGLWLVVPVARRCRGWFCRSPEVLGIFGSVALRILSDVVDGALVRGARLCFLVILCGSPRLQSGLRFSARFPSMF